MTSLSFYESQHGINTEFLSKNEVVKIMELYANHRWEEFKKTKSVFNAERWIAENHFEETRNRLK